MCFVMISAVTQRSLLDVWSFLFQSRAAGSQLCDFKAVLQLLSYNIFVIYLLALFTTLLLYKYPCPTQFNESGTAFI